MGWTFLNHREPGLSHAEFFARQFFRPPADGGTSHIIESAYVPAGEGSVFYAAVRTDSGEQAETWALVVLTRGRSGAEFGWKEMDETMGPAEDCCPARVLDLLSETRNTLALEWRQRCRDRIARLEEVREGVGVAFSTDFLTPRGPCRQFVAVNPSQNIFRSPDGATYRIRGWKRSDFELSGRDS